MCIRDRLWSFIAKIAILLLCVAAFFGTTGFPTQRNSEFFFTALKYFSVMALIPVALYYLGESIATLVALREGRMGRSRPAAHLKGALVMLMIFEIIVYSVLLLGNPLAVLPSQSVLSGALIHYILPLAVVADYALFDPKGRFSASDPIYWLTVPLLYFSFVIIGAQLGMLFLENSSYPYYFLNPELSSWGEVLKNLLFMTFGYLLLSYLLFAVDKVLARAESRRNEELRFVATSAFATPQRLPRKVYSKEKRVPRETGLNHPPQEGDEDYPPSGAAYYPGEQNTPMDGPAPYDGPAGDTVMFAPMGDYSKPS